MISCLESPVTALEKSDRAEGSCQYLLSKDKEGKQYGFPMTKGSDMA